MSYKQVVQAWRKWKRQAKKGDYFLVPGTIARVDCDEAGIEKLKVTVACRTAKHSEFLRFESDEVKFLQVLIDAGSEDAESMLQACLKDRVNLYVKDSELTVKEKHEKLYEDSGGQAEFDQGLRHNDGKNRLDLIPCSLIDGVGRVLTFGAKKYEADNWRKFTPQQVKECIGSAMRHIEQYRQGNWLDPESGLPHLAHAATNLGFILELHKED